MNYPTAAEIDEQVKRAAAYKRGVRDGLHDTVPNFLPGVDAMHEDYERGVTEGRARRAMTVEQRLAIIMEHYGSVDPAAQEDIPRQVKLGNRYVTVTRDDDDDFYLASYETLDDVWDGLADEVTGERSWWPHAIFDLQTGETIPYGVTVKVFRADDDHALIDELTSEGVR